MSSCLRTCVTLSTALLASAATAQATWTNRTTAATPALGMDFATAFDEVRGVLVVFGGREQTANTNSVTDVQWHWNGSTWASITPAIKPPPRYRHDMAFDAARGVVVLSGGMDNNSRLPDTWEYDGASWTLRHTAGSNEDIFNHRMVFDAARGVVVRFGGSGAGGHKGDTHTWTGSSWLLRSTGGPSPREQHAMAYDRQRQRVILFGGFGSSGSLGDTWQWDGTAWQQLAPANPPAARYEAGLAYTGSSRKLVLFGGLAGTQRRNDTWTWDGTNWTQVTPVGVPPTMAYFELDLDTVRDRVVLVRGQEFSTYHTEQWEFHSPVTAPATWTAFGSGCTSSAGMPQLAAAAGSLPFVGGPFTVVMTGIPGTFFNPAFLVTGFSTTSWNGSPLPLELSGFGMPGCHALIAPVATELLWNNAGVATKTWNIPLWSDLVGVEFHAQGAVMDSGINAASFVLSNAGTAHIGQV